MFPWIRQALGFAGGALAVFHAWVFAAQVESGRLDDPWLIVRWIAAAFVVVALAALRRNGESVWGGKGIAICVLAALLHGPAIGSNIGSDSLARPESLATSVVQLLSSPALALGLLTLLGVRRTRQHAIRFAVCALAFAANPKLASGVTPVFFSRPPPRCA